MRIVVDNLTVGQVLTEYFGYAKDPPTDKTIRAWYKQFTETLCLCKQKSSGRAHAYVQHVTVLKSMRFVQSPHISL